MLPFLKPKGKQSTGIAMEYRKPDDESDAADMHAIEVAMEDFAKAHERKDHKGMARAFQAAFQILESAPHEEYPHESEQE